MSSSARGCVARHSKPEVPESTSIRQRYQRVGLKPGLQRAALQRQVQVRGALVGHGEVVECAERPDEIGAGGQLERVEAAAGEIEQLIALNIAYRPQLAAKLVAVAQQLRLAVAATFGDTAELDRHQPDTQEILSQR